MKRGFAGFTLIELLVVIAIIAILAAILFPVFVSAKSSGKRAADLGHQRQIGTAISLYCDDNHGTYPWISRAGTRRYFPTYPDNVNTTISGELMYLLKPYVKNRLVFYCSAVDAYGRQYTCVGQSEANPPFMYIGFYYYVGDGWSGPKPISQNGNPRRILLSCIGGGVSTSSGGAGEGRSGHGKAQGIYTFADGHAAFVHHFNYPYSYTECVALKNMSKLLMPKW